ncbi:MAG TPA: hypothetical protein VFI25_12095 [Planctomycetota bacterium]|nr:hypothetical protein [Planctomycetota bacterium]
MRITTPLLFAVAASLLPSSARGQGCTIGAVVLSVTPDTPVPAGAPVTVSVTGTPGAGVLVFRGPNAGATTLSGPGPLSGTTICLNSPFAVVPIGWIPPSGTRTVQMPTPPNAPVGSSLNFQAVTIAMSPTGAVVDTSGTDSVTFVAPPPPPPCTPGPLGLTITPDAPVQPNDTIVRTVTAPAGSLVLLAGGPNPGSTNLPFGGGLNLCLGTPFFVHFFGIVPASGSITHSHTVPPGAPLPGTMTITFQAIAFSFSSGTLSVATSNTDTLTF